MNPYLAYTHERNFGCRLREIVWRGHRCVTLENERLRVLVVADKGADVLELLYKPLDVELLWRSYHGLRRAGPERASSPLARGRSAISSPAAGTRCCRTVPNRACIAARPSASTARRPSAVGLPHCRRRARADCGHVLGAPRAHADPRREDTDPRRGRVDAGHRRAALCEAGHPIEVLWGQHPTFGWPFLEAGCRVFLPPCRARVGAAPPSGHRLRPDQEAPWPHLAGVDGSVVDLSMVPGPEARSHDFVRLDDLSDGWYAIVNPHRGLGFALRWDPALFPTLGFWQLFRGGADYPGTASRTSWRWSPPATCRRWPARRRAAPRSAWSRARR